MHKPALHFLFQWLSNVLLCLLKKKLVFRKPYILLILVIHYLYLYYFIF